MKKNQGRSYIRRYIFISFCISEKTRWDKDLLIEQILKTFDCKSVIIAQKKPLRALSKST